MKKTHIILIVMIAVMAGVILVLTFGNGNASYGNFADARSNPDGDIKISGKLAEGQAVVYDPQVNPNECSFYLTDKKGETQKVVLHQAKPRDIEKSGATDEIVVTGNFVNGEFHVAKDNIQLKCPSKYNKGTEVTEK